ncbi:hypothetical protein SSX86_011872 [Deinandra increscens subsp. villosa]|uniref:Bromo domain-containing protein n=1 Tax=Deinandra increscens subsp. villosa TaxID=3103831 RepID=A0AAP0D4S8_9ASTR
MIFECKKVLQDGENSKKRRKKGPAISGGEPSGTRKAQQQQSRFKSLREDELQGPPSRTRASLKRRHYEPSSTKIQVEKKPNQEDQARNGETDTIIEETVGASSITQPLPDKQTFELILDTLQRKDIYEIFAEPVDPEEVEDYYEIIEEPMDFGTMRAKLHEGLYTSLEQFEHDVFLISGNAMHFNSSGTIFFRQAHGIHKLAKRVFHVLRTNPENFESEFSGNRRRSCRKSQDETNRFNRKVFLRTNEKTGGSKRCDPIEVDRRSTYKPDLDLNNDSWSKSLIHLNHQEHSYSQSLMHFVKDLGPTAQMVAKRKLQNLIGDHQTPIHHDSGKQPQIPTGQMRFNASRSVLYDGIMKNLINRDVDLRSWTGIDRDESNGHRMMLLSGDMDSVVASTSVAAAGCKKVLQDGENSKKRRKKGPAISGGEPSGTRKAQQQQSRFKSLREDELQGPPSRTRASLKRRHYEPSSTKIQVEKKPNQEDQARNGETDTIIEETVGASSITQPLPDKQTFELILDTLQRKDIYEIFAEPVDPEEVEDYYEIIEEPMDFGTMRAKLHEGLYTSLEQFEHDVFLISGNAMHFNSSGTIFFRQAHGIHKLAKRVFHVLRTNPENFESEFSGNRRRSCRKSQDETNRFNRKVFLRTNEKTGTLTADAYLKNTNSLIHTTYLCYTGGSKRCDPIEVDRRSTYKPDLDLNNDSWSKSLIHLNHQEHSYSQSLMQFVKDLGPTAQMVAKRKLQNLIGAHQTPIHHDSGKQPQIPTGQMRVNSSRPVLNDEIVKNPINRDVDLRSLNGIDRDESNRLVASTSLPAAGVRQGAGEWRFGLNLGFLKSKLGKMKEEGRECEETSWSSNNNPFDPKYLTLRL